MIIWLLKSYLFFTPLRVTERWNFGKNFDFFHNY